MSNGVLALICVVRIAEPLCGYIFWASPTHLYIDNSITSALHLLPSA